jgi:hypothetical protein
MIPRLKEYKTIHDWSAALLDYCQRLEKRVVVLERELAEAKKKEAER